MRLHPGSWWLSSPYNSPHPIEVSAPGFHAVIPANLDRPGNEWPIGEIVVRGGGPTVFTIHVQAPSLAGPVPTFINSLVATPSTPVRMVPLRGACGADVEWYLYS
jgi:hypothetical protein